MAPKPRPSRATQPTFERIDVDAIAKAATAETDAALAACADPQDRLTLANAIIADTDQVLPGLRQRRDAMAVSLSIYDGVRAVWAAAGVGRTRMAGIKRDALGGTAMPTEGASVDRAALIELAKAHKVRRYDKDTALRNLPATATRIVEAEARGTAARAARDAIILDMLASGAITKSEAARLIDRNPSLVSHMLARAGTA